MSPIEHMLLGAFVDLDDSRGLFMRQQVKVAGYTCDFIVDPVGLVVECDGHEFHERTKQQASYDRARDRDLLAAGYPTIRFTGSDIHRDSEQCAREIVRVAKSIESGRVDEAQEPDWAALPSDTYGLDEEIVLVVRRQGPFRTKKQIATQTLGRRRGDVLEAVARLVAAGELVVTDKGIQHAHDVWVFSPETAR